MKPKKYVNEFAPIKAQALRTAMMRASVSVEALRRKSQLPKETVEKAVRGADMSNSIYDGLLKNVEDIRERETERS